MNHQQKRALSENVPLLQGTLRLEPVTLNALVASRVLSDSERKVLMAEKIPSVQILALVTFLVKKDSTHFHFFLDVLRARGYEPLAAILQQGRTGASSKVDKEGAKVKELLKSKLGTSKVRAEILNELSMRLRRRETYMDDLAIGDCGRSSIHSSSSSSSLTSLEKESIPMETSFQKASATASTSAASTEQELRHSEKQIEKLKKEKEDINQMLSKLRDDQKDLHQDYRTQLEQNNHLMEALRLISASQQAHMSPVDRRAAPQNTIRRLEIKERQQKESIVQLESELESLKTEVEEAERELHVVLEREKTYKRALRLDDWASEDEVVSKIQQMENDGAKYYDEIGKLRDDLRKKADLQRRIQRLQRDKEFAEQRLKNKQLLHEGHRMSLDTTSMTSMVIQDAGALNSEPEDMLDLHPALPTTTLTLKKILRKQGKLYCVLCRSVFELQSKGNDRQCMVHHEPFKNNRWLCCKRDGLSKPGCLGLSHCYIIKEQFMLTNGESYLDIKGSGSDTDRSK